MNHLLEDYQSFISTLQQRLTKEQTYFHRFSSETQVTHSIEQQQKEISTLLASLKEKIKINSWISAIKNDLIADHYDYPVVRLQQRLETREKGSKWREYLQANHEVAIEVKVMEVIPLVRSQEITENLIVFEALRFHLHHVDKVATSALVKYHPKYNLYHPSSVVDNKLFKDQRKIVLRLTHEIRTQNLRLYTELFEESAIKIVAQASYGSVLGIANIYIDDLGVGGAAIRDEFRSVTFRSYTYNEEGEEILSNGHAFIGKIKVSIDSHPIAPEIEELKVNAEKEKEKRKTSKSKSPNRLVSTTPSRSKSPKRKRQLLNDITTNSSQTKHLTIFQGTQYKYRLDYVGAKREITYRQLKNIKERRIQLIKIEQIYYLKCFLIRENSEEKGHLFFEFNEQGFILHVVTDTLFGLIDYPKYARGKEKKEKFSNKLVCFDSGKLIYPRPSNRILKNFIKQTAVDGMLSNLFIKTVFSECQISTNLPFILTDIVHKEDGYMLNYYYMENSPIESEVNTSLMIFLESRARQSNEIHVFDCTVVPREAARDTIQKELRVTPLNEFYQISMTMIANEKFEYQIRSTVHTINVINGKNFKFSPESDQLLLQLCFPTPPTADLIISDSKSRCFFIRLAIVQDCPE